MPVRAFSTPVLCGIRVRRPIACQSPVRWIGTQLHRDRRSNRHSPLMRARVQPVLASSVQALQAPLERARRPARDRPTRAAVTERWRTKLREREKFACASDLSWMSVRPEPSLDVRGQRKPHPETATFLRGTSVSGDGDWVAPIVIGIGVMLSGGNASHATHR